MNVDLSDIPNVPQNEQGYLPQIDLSDIPDEREPHGVTESFAPTFSEKAIEFMTGGHITYDPHKLRPPKESPTQAPETAEIGFFEDPITSLTMGALAGARLASKPLGKLTRGLREAAAWFTGGATEVPAIAKGGAKLTARAISAKPMEKTMGKAALKQPLGREAIKIIEKDLVKGIPLATGRQAELLQKGFKERFLEGKEPIKKPELKVVKEKSTSNELASAKVVEKVGSSKPKDILAYYQKKYPALKDVKIGGLKSTKESGRLVDEGVVRVKDGKTTIHLTEDASPITVRHEIEHLLDIIHKQPITGKQAFARFTHKKFAEEYLAKKPTHHDYLNTLLDEVKQGEVIRIPHEEGGYRRASTYPKFMQKQGWTGKEVAVALDKELKGLKLGPRQQEIVDTALSEAKIRYISDVEYLGKGIDKLEELPKSLAETSSKDMITFYGGLPLHKIGEVYTKSIGTLAWDKGVMKGIPKLLEKVPGGKAINRAFLYDYRGNLPDTPSYMKSMEDMRRYQAVGREYAVDLGKRLQAMPEQLQLKVGEFIRGETEDIPKNLRDLGVEAKRTLYELGRQSAELGLLSEKTFFENAGRYMPRLYTSKEYQSLLTRYNLKKATRLDLSRFKKRKDIPKAIREEMGEILTPGYPVAKGIAQLTHDVEMARWFTGIAQNREWALPKQIVKKLNKSIPEGWKQLPSNKKLGQLSEAYVHPEIFRDLNETIRIIETPEKVWRKSLGAWKFGKVILSPKTHVRNLMSNSVLAHLGGLPMYEQPIYLVKAANEMRTKGKYWKIAKEEGIFRHTFTEGELRDLFGRVEGEMGGIKAGGIPEALGKIGQAWMSTKAVGRKAADLYQAEEQIFKIAKMIHNMERKGMSGILAAKDAEKWLFNYSKVTKFQEKYRTKWYGAPFCTFTFKALPRIAEATVKTPWRFAMPLSMIYALERSAKEIIGDTTEEIKAKKELRSEWMKGKGLGKMLENIGLPNFARVPFIDDNGREYYLNLTYILPWGDIGEGGGIWGIPGGIRPFSQPFLKEPISQMWGKGGYDPFWEEEIVKEKDIAGKKGMERVKTELKLRGKHVVQAMAPTLVMDVTKAISAIREEPDYKGRFRPRAIVAADIFAGIKMYPVDYIERAEQEINKLHPKQGYLARKILGDIKTYSIKKQAMEKTGRKVTFYDEKIKEKIKQLIGLANETREVGEVFETIRKHKK